MQSFLAKCAALGIVAGGFTLTGDMSRLAERGQRLLDARTVPSETPAEPASTDGIDSSARAALGPHPTDTPPTASAAPAPPTAPQQPGVPQTQSAKTEADAVARALPSAAVLDAPIGRAVAVPAPPANGPEAVDLRQGSPGSRVLVWVRRSGSTGRARSMDLIALDLIDPSTGEALEHRHAAQTHGSERTTVHAAPRRVVITRDAGGRIAKGAILKLTPLHGVNGLGAEETIGTVLAVDLQCL